MTKPIPIVLFAYARPDLLQRTLACLKGDQVPLIYAFSDAPRTPDKASAVEAVRRILHEIDWCEVVLYERTENLGLGRSILAGVSEIFQKHEAIIVFEDDLICVPETYKYLCAALEYYRDDPRVMSVTGYSHPHFRPSSVTVQPYFDGRFSSLVWGTWARSWRGMDRPALELMRACKARGIDPARYGADLPLMAKQELSRNIWAVRFAYLHILNRGLVLFPHQSMVEHIGYDERATNAPDAGGLETDILQSVALVPEHWPEPVENPLCAPLYQEHYKYVLFWPRVRAKAGRLLRRIMKVLPMRITSAVEPNSDP